MIRIGRRRQAAELHQAGHQQQPGLCRGQVRAADEVGVVQRHEALGVAAPDADDRKPAVHGSQHQPVPRSRGGPAVRGEPLDDKAGERRRFQHVSDQRDKIDFRLGIGRRRRRPSSWRPWRSRPWGSPCRATPPSGPLIATGTVAMREPSRRTPVTSEGRRGEVHLGPPSVARGRQIVKQRRPVMAGCTEDAAVTAGRHIAARPRIGLLDGAGGEDALLLDQHRAGLVAALFVLPRPARRCSRPNRRCSSARHC